MPENSHATGASPESADTPGASSAARTSAQLPASSSSSDEIVERASREIDVMFIATAALTVVLIVGVCMWFTWGAMACYGGGAQ